MVEEFVPRTMSTQHPDNVTTPFFANSEIIGGEDEVKETYYVFSHLSCHEQLWDCEGKEADQFVVRKLLTNYEPYFKTKRIGRDFRLTLRIPNTDVEKNEAKVVLETLESIPRSADVARIFYGDNEVVPIFEVAIPMTTNAVQPALVREYYRKFVAGRSTQEILPGVTVEKWVGKVFPEDIRIIPLFEDKESILHSDKIIAEYLRISPVKDYLRVWYARSDPALNYGSLATVLLLKIAFNRLYQLEQKVEIPLYPIIGCGSAPFRGNLYPGNVEDFLRGYPSVQTFTIQSAFKYDYPVEDVQEAVRKLNQSKRKEPYPVESESYKRELVEKLSACYREDLARFYPLISSVSRVIPRRRRRKLHIGLFGYTRGEGGLVLPRAIPFTAAAYSIGVPPEFFGLRCLTEHDIERIERTYPSVFDDLGYAVRFLNEDNLRRIDEKFLQGIAHIVDRLDQRRDTLHAEMTTRILDTLLKKEGGETLGELVVRAAHQRHFLG